MNATKSRNRVKAARSIRLVVPLNDEGKNGVVRIQTERETADYFVSRIGSDFGDGFRVLKIGGNGESYDVHLSEQGRRCECKGHLRHGHCKHGDGLAALKRAGRLQ